MTFRPLMLLAALLMLALLSGCGTDTKAVDSLDSSGGQAHYSGVWLNVILDSAGIPLINPVTGRQYTWDNPASRAQYMGYSLKEMVNVGGTGNTTTTGTPPVSVTSPLPAYIMVDYSITCLSCHPSSTSQPNGDINANATILKDYARSGHADVAAIPWTVPESGASCQRCHTTFGFLYHLKNYAPVNYDPLTPFVGISLSSPTISPQWTDVSPLTSLDQQEEYRKAMQVLVCSTCHPENGLTLGTLRASTTPGGYVALWSANKIIAQVTFPDAGASNLCIRCHSSRAAGPNITPAGTTTAHYLPVAAMVYSGTADFVRITANTTSPAIVPDLDSKFTGLGYEFSGKSYLFNSAHKTLGTPGGKGPCVACHMSEGSGHALKVVTADAIGNITAIKTSACDVCHGVMTPELLNVKKTGFKAAADLLDAALQAKGVYWYSGARASTYITVTSPATTTMGFYPVPYDVDALIGTTQLTINNAQYATKATDAGLTTMDLQGAAYNLWLCKHKNGDPAAYVHNSNYIKKLIFDSLDVLSSIPVSGPVATYLDGESTVAGVQRP